MSKLISAGRFSISRIPESDTSRIQCRKHPQRIQNVSYELPEVSANIFALYTSSEVGQERQSEIVVTSVVEEQKHKIALLEEERQFQLAAASVGEERQRHANARRQEGDLEEAPPVAGHRQRRVRGIRAELVPIAPGRAGERQQAAGGREQVPRVAALSHGGDNLQTQA